MVLEDRDGHLLGARIAADGQWRFPRKSKVPQRFAQALTTFEDRRFYQHPGIDPIGIGRAIQQNFKNGRIVSGGSTLTMQTIRMSRGKQSRSVFQKIVEAILATRLEWRHSKSEILSLYAANAPFGGNVVGLDAASWRYYGKQADQLTWAEAATLAVLPNSPALIHPGRNRDALHAKRNRLLRRLHQDGHIDAQSLELALLETLPENPLRLPNLSPHLLETIRSGTTGKDQQQSAFVTTLQRNLQNQVNTILSRHHNRLVNNGIHNLAAVVLDVEKNEVLAYTGNISEAGAAHQAAVDVIPAPRSTGSILKPFLYAMAIDDGIISPNSLLPDIPTYMGGYRPENYNESFDGMVPARRVLARSLNVPMVRLLHEFGLEKFHFGLQQLKIKSVNQPPSHYGLTLILGGAEASLWEITNAYAGIARTLNHFQPNSGQYQKNEFTPANWLTDKNTTNKKSPDPQNLQREYPVLSASACWQTVEAMRTVERPNSEGSWEQFRSSKRIAWKTGTSFGFRDAWAVGLTPRYVVGVWAGNADGEGRPGLVGVNAAGPVLFDIFSLLKSPEWFSQPMDEMTPVALCAETGYRALADCPVDTTWLGPGRERLAGCQYHQRIHLDPTRQYRVNSNCMEPSAMQAASWLVLPPVEESYYQKNHPEYKLLPPLHPDCPAETASETIQVIYPPRGATIFVPVGLDGKMGRTVFSATHRNMQTRIFWHLDDEFLGTTQDFHELALHPAPGKHILTLVDSEGATVKRQFEILEKSE